MKKMSRRILAVVLTLCIAMSVFTSAVLALGEGSITSLKLAKTDNGIIYSATATMSELASYAASYHYAGGHLSALRFICTLEDKLIVEQVDTVQNSDFNMTGTDLFELESVEKTSDGVKAVYKLTQQALEDWKDREATEVESALSSVVITITSPEVAATKDDFASAANKYGKLVTTGKLVIDLEEGADFDVPEMPITVAVTETISVYSGIPSAGGGGGSSSDDGDGTGGYGDIWDVFDDVPHNAWFVDEVRYVYENGLMFGVAKRLFAPYWNTTRAQIMTILARMNGVDTSTGTPWYSVGLNWAMANGISDGTNPEVNITREQLAAMLYRYVKLKGLDATAEYDLSLFKDADKVSAYAVEPMKWACNAGIIKGADGYLNPRDFATRAEVATMLMRFHKLIFA